MTTSRNPITQKIRYAMLLAVAVASTLALTGCAARKIHESTSVVQYLYPDKKERVEPSIPRLVLPLRVGIAFVPEEKASQAALAEKDKLDLMKKIANQFKQYPFVKSIELIPTLYLTPKGSFENLDQIRTMYDIDVIALLSLDQVQHTDEDLRSIGYWTIVGLYAVKGELNDTSTMLDAAVFHIPSRKLLFRAPGTSKVKGTSTPVNLSEQLRNDGKKGIDEAEAQLVANLKGQLEEFKAKVKDAPDEYVIQRRPGYTGGGSMGGWWLALMAICGIFGCGRGRSGRDS